MNFWTFSNLLNTNNNHFNIISLTFALGLSWFCVLFPTSLPSNFICSSGEPPPPPQLPPAPCFPSKSTWASQAGSVWTPSFCFSLSPPLPTSSYLFIPPSPQPSRCLVYLHRRIVLLSSSLNKTRLWGEIVLSRPQTFSHGPYLPPPPKRLAIPPQA